MRFFRFLLRVLYVGYCLALRAWKWFFIWLWMLVTRRGREARKERFAREVLDLFRGLGATFIKVGQIMSTRPDLLPPHIVRALEALQDDVGPFAFEHVEATLREELGRSPHDVFTDLSPAPIASASVAQVHKARLADGRVVAVKVRRPHIEETCDFDLRMMRLGAWFMSLVPSIRLLAPVESVDEFARAIKMQLDFRIEAENSRRFRKNFAGDPDVSFPALCEELCTARVLVMEFVPGWKILDTKRPREGGARLARIGLRTLMKMVFIDGFVHADLHPGNIFVTPEGKVVILDLGLCAELDDENRTAFAGFFAAWAQNDGKTMARIMADFSPNRGKIPDYPGFERELVAFAGRYLGKRMEEIQVGKVLFDMLGILRRYRVRANPTFTMVNIAIAVTEGIGKQLDPKLDTMAEGMPFFAQMGLLGLSQ